MADMGASLACTTEGVVGYNALSIANRLNARIIPINSILVCTTEATTGYNALSIGNQRNYSSTVVAPIPIRQHWG
jgi:hypothetical protein